MFDFAPTMDHDFDVKPTQLYDMNGQPIPGMVNVMRMDTGESLGVHSSGYRIVKHDDVVNQMLDAAKESGLPTAGRMDIATIERGRRMRIEMLFDEVVNEPAVGDYVKFRISAFNSYDGTWSFGTRADGLRLWCTNGCTTADAVAHVTFKHTKNIDISGVGERMMQAARHFHERNDEWRAWRNIKVTDAMAETFFRHALCRRPTLQKQELLFNNARLDQLLGQWRTYSKTMGRNKWALYNSLTDWASHPDSKRPEITRANREGELIRAMRSKKWNELELA